MNTLLKEFPWQKLTTLIQRMILCQLQPLVCRASTHMHPSRLDLQTNMSIPQWNLYANRQLYSKIPKGQLMLLWIIVDR